MQNWKLVYNTATGRLVSSGSGPIDSLPAELSFVELTADEANGYRNGTLKWDEATRTLIPTPPPAVTAAEFVDEQGFSGNRTTTMLYLKLRLDAAGKTSPKLAAVQAWMDQMIAAGVMNPDEARSDWPVAPWSFTEASGEALAALNS